jgi:hypothetical protein
MAAAMSFSRERSPRFVLERGFRFPVAVCFAMAP